MGSQYISYNRYEEIHFLLSSIGMFFFIELPSDFAAMQEEIERQKAALLDKTKHKETIEISGKNFSSNVHI